ncbi:MFS transporter [Chloroflexota bacterium]
MNIKKYNISYKWIAMSVVSMGIFMGTLDMGAMRVALPHLEQVFETGPDNVVWVSLIWLLTGSSLMLAMGRIGDIFGRKKLFTLGMAIFTLGLILCSLAQNLTQLIAFRFIQSFGAALNISIQYAILTASFPSNERGKAIGIMGAVAGLGLLSGPALGGFFLDLLGWRSIFYLRIPFGIVSFVMAWVLLKEQTPLRRAEKFDLPGAIIFSSALTCLILAMNRSQSFGWTSPWILTLGIAGVLLLILFLLVEKRAEYPLLDLGIFRNRLLSTASASHILFYMSTSSANFLLPFYLIQAIGFSASSAGLLLVLIPALNLMVAPLSGRLSDKLGSVFLCSSGLMMVSLALFMLSGLQITASLSQIILYLVMLGIGMGLFIAPNTSAIMGGVASTRLGSASAMIGTLRQLGMSFGLALTGSVFTASQLSYSDGLTSQGLLPDIIEKLSTVGGFQNAIFVALGVAATGFLISMFRGKN